jgi:SAM-dependent methyltransferase
MTIKEKLQQLLRPGRTVLRRAVQRPGVGRVTWGDFARIRPINSNWGFERGTPIDRYYIESFLEKNAAHIQGRVLEVAGDEYTKKYGGNRVDTSDVLHHNDSNPRATIVADLSDSSQVTDALFDCIICTQTLQFIYDVSTAVTSLRRFLKPGGILLMTVPGISQISPEDMESTGDYWRFTTATLQRLLGAESATGDVSIESYGNVKSSIGFLHGISATELSEDELLHSDPQFQLLLTAVVTKPS